MQVKDVMTQSPASCHAEATLAVAGNQMLEGRFGVLPVVDEHGKAVGMVTDRDIARAAVTRQRNAAHIAVHEIMSQELLSCHPDDEIDAALGKMVDHCLRRLPVVDADGLLVGILSIEDVALRAVDADQGISRGDFFDVYKRLCQRPSPPEPDITPADTATPG